MKKCVRCQKEKPYCDFPKDKQTKDKLNSWCKKCKSDWNKSSLSYKKYRKEWVEKNKEYIRIATKKWAIKNGKKYRTEKEQKYGLGIGTIQRYGVKIALFVYDRAERKCEQCGGENDLTIHHLDQQGRNFENRGLQPNNDIENLVVWCRRCHGSFHGKQNKGIKKSKKKVG